MKIDEAKKQRGVSCIYGLVFPNGKRYVGKTKDLSSRMGLYTRFGGSNCVQAAIDEFGWDAIDIEVLSKVEVDDQVDLELCLSILEIKYIRELRTSESEFGYNISLGGEVLGIPINYLVTDSSAIKSMSNQSKPVLVYDLRGDFVSEYDSLSKCAYHYGINENTLRDAIGSSKPCKDKWYFRWKRYDYAPEKIEVNFVEERERVRYKNVVKEIIVEKEREVHTYTPALRYDMNGEFCGEYKSKRDACMSFMNRTCDWGVYTRGYILFKKVSEEYPLQIEPYHVLNKKQLKEYYVPASELPDKEVFSPLYTAMADNGNVAKPLCVDGKYTNIKHTFTVLQCKLNGEVVAEFPSLRDAARETGVAYSQIYACIKGTTKKAAGYIWKRKEENGE